MKTLIKGQNIKLHGLNYQVSSDENYMYNGTGHNDDIFIKLNIEDPKSFVENIVGYKCHGVFPQVKSIEDLTKVVEALINYKSRKITIAQYQKHIQLACEDWQARLFKELGKQLLETGEVNVPDSLIEEMYQAVEEKHVKILDELFPDFREKLITSADLRTGEVIEIVESSSELVPKGRWLMKTTNGYLDLKDFSLWNNCTLKGRLIEIEITKK